MRVLVKHIASKTKKGISFIKEGRPVVQKIEAMYVSGKIRTLTGDVWEVIEKKGKHKGVWYDYETTTDTVSG